MATATQKRTNTQYLKNMRQVLQLDVNFVLFVDIVAKPVVDKMRKGRENRTAVTVLDFKSLPYYRWVVYLLIWRDVFVF